MTNPISRLALILMPFGLAACSQEAGKISRDSEPFDGVAATASIALVGNEPFWGVDIMPAGDGFTARYSTPENIDGLEFPVTRFAGNNGIGFNGELDGASVQIAVTPGDCSDGMSDRTYPYTTTIAMADVTLYGCGYTSDEPFTGEEAP